MTFMNLISIRAGRIAAGCLLVSLGLLATTFPVQAEELASVHAVEAGADDALWVLSPGHLYQVKSEETFSYSLPEAAKQMASLSLAVATDKTLYLAGEDLGNL
jgi:hypothetical protein